MQVSTCSAPPLPVTRSPRVPACCLLRSWRHLLFVSLHRRACLCILPCAVQSKVDGALLALTVLAMPAACYLAIHASVISHWMHLWSLMILGSGPLLYICALPNGLWWVPMSPRLVVGLSRLLMVLAAFGLLAGEAAAAATSLL